MRLIDNDVILNKTSAALGIFDGVHLGHRKILNAARSFSNEKRSFAVFTFNTLSIKNKHGKPYKYIYTEEQKNQILESLGVEYIYSPEAELLMNMSGEEFAKKILKEKMNVEVVVCGENFRFGKGASCGVTELEKYGDMYGFKVECCDLLKVDEKTVSSGNIKENLKNGKISYANKLLGQKYFLNGKVMNGNRIGRTLNFPTINQFYEDGQLIPKFGAYISSCKLSGKEFAAVTNIGIKPTVEKSSVKPISETHIIGFSGDLYGKNIKVDFSEFLRDEQKFPSLNHLKEQILKDSLKSSYFFEKK